MTEVHLRGESGAVLYFNGPVLPEGIAHRLNRGDLTRVTAAGEPWDEAAEAAEELEGADAIARERNELRTRVAELEAQLAELGEAGREPGDAGEADDESPETPADDDDGGVPDGEPDGEPPPGPPDAPPLPSVRENRPVWVDFAIGQGMDRAEANSLTKSQLIERLTTAPPAP